jgi:hypothetical protein
MFPREADPTGGKRNHKITVERKCTVSNRTRSGNVDKGRAAEVASSSEFLRPLLSTLFGSNRRDGSIGIYTCWIDCSLLAHFCGTRPYFVNHVLTKY